MKRLAIDEVRTRRLVKAAANGGSAAGEDYVVEALSIYWDPQDWEHIEQSQGLIDAALKYGAIRVPEGVSVEGWFTSEYTDETSASFFVLIRTGPITLLSAYQHLSYLPKRSLGTEEDAWDLLSYVVTAANTVLDGLDDYLAARTAQPGTIEQEN